MDLVKVAAEVTSSDVQPGRLLTWDRVGFLPTEYGKAIGLSDDLIGNIESINIGVVAGEVATMVVAFYTKCKSINELQESLPDDIKKADIQFHLLQNGQGYNLWSMKLLLASLAASVLPPYPYATGE